LEIFEIQRPLAKGFLKISHHRIIIIAERLYYDPAQKSNGGLKEEEE
jgi:hypothetical protein